ncbi:MAG: PRTRC system protein C, partial [Bryobacteraceae bacterium]
MAASYPEITTAALTGPEAVDGDPAYTFTESERRQRMTEKEMLSELPRVIEG